MGQSTNERQQQAELQETCRSLGRFAVQLRKLITPSFGSHFAAGAVYSRTDKGERREGSRQPGKGERAAQRRTERNRARRERADSGLTGWLAGGGVRDRGRGSYSSAVLCDGGVIGERQLTPRACI